MSDEIRQRVAKLLQGQSSNNNALSYLVTITLIAVLAIGALLLVDWVRPPDKGHDNGAINTAVLGFAGMIVLQLVSILKQLSNSQKIDDNTAVTIESAQQNTAAIHEAKEEVKQSVQEVKADVGSAATAAATAAASAVVAASSALSQQKP